MDKSILYCTLGSLRALETDGRIFVILRANKKGYANIQVYHRKRIMRIALPLVANFGRMIFHMTQPDKFFNFEKLWENIGPDQEIHIVIDPDGIWITRDSVSEPQDLLPQLPIGPTTHLWAELRQHF